MMPTNSLVELVCKRRAISGRIDKDKICVENPSKLVMNINI